jgi:hypothetical protein
MRLTFVLLVAAGLAACTQETKSSTKRAAIRRVGGTTFELVPEVGQHPYCLAYTVSEKQGVIRQLTMSRTNMTPTCPAAEPVGKHSFRAPLEEGPVKVHVFFLSQPVNAASLNQQLLDSENRLKLSVMNMRLPGNATIETLDFKPEQDVAPLEGTVVITDAGAAELGLPPAPAEGDAGAAVNEVGPAK